MDATVLSSLSLFAGTPEQILESRRRSAVEWGKDRTLEEYLARDEFTDKQEVARNGRLITWVLASRNDPTSLSFLCSCETFRRDGVISAGGNPKKVICYGIASVFTPPCHRGKGYASHMMRLLHWVIADASLLPAVFPSEWGVPPDRVACAGDGIFSALWSDVGAGFYRRCGPTGCLDGWVVRSPFSTTWDVKPGKSNADTAGWVLLDEAGAMKLWEDDAENIARAFSSADNFKVSFSFLPHKGVAAFQHWRNIDILKKFGYTSIRHWGVSKDSHTFATWTFEITSPSKTLLITRLSSLSADFESLLSMIMTVASKHGMQNVEVYNLPDHLQSSAARLGGITFERNEHLSCFKWYGKEDAADVAWLLNER
ncbi:hypothetical protein C0993_011015 [Termitomyces sp. T159_Od127]|nr:hypothetical protein C0993_011015 [Termitomyces sp. T159_Od127]